MNKKHHASNRGAFIATLQLLFGVACFMAVTCLIDEIQASHRDPRYLRLEGLSEAVTRANNNLVLSLDPSSEESIGVSPVEMQGRADEAFEELSRTAQNVPEKYVPSRARQILKDGPRRLIKAERETVDSGGNAGVR